MKRKIELYNFRNVKTLLYNLLYYKIIKSIKSLLKICSDEGKCAALVNFNKFIYKILSLEVIFSG